MDDEAAVGGELQIKSQLMIHTCSPTLYHKSSLLNRQNRYRIPFSSREKPWPSFSWLHKTKHFSKKSSSK